MIEVTPKFANTVCRHEMTIISGTGSIEVVNATTEVMASRNPGMSAFLLIAREHICAGVNGTFLRAKLDQPLSGLSVLNMGTTVRR